MVDFENRKIDLPLSELLHLILQQETIRRTIRIIITKETSAAIDVTAVTRCITNHECLLDTVYAPSLMKYLVEAALHILWKVSSTGGLSLGNETLYRLNVISKLADSKALMIFDITVPDKANTHMKVFVVRFHLVNELLQSFLATTDPRAHGTSAVHDQAQVKVLSRVI